MVRVGLSLVSLLSFLLFSAPDTVRAEEPPAATREPVIRVAVRIGSPQTEIRCAGQVRVWRRGSGLQGSLFGPGVCFQLAANRMDHSIWSASPGSGTVRDWGIRVSEARKGKLGVFAEELVFEPLDSGAPLRVNDKLYHGEMVVRLSDPGKLTVINVLRLEAYLRGVVPREIGSEGVPTAALKAQAIAARSYALFYRGRHETDGFDLLAGPGDQVYGGIDAERDQSTRAVVATRGFVAVYHGRAIRANYSSTCGGVTESAHRVWRGEHYPYLKAVRDRPRSGKAFCEASRYFRWEETWGCVQLQRIIAEHLPKEVPAAGGKELGRLKGLKALKRSPSERVEVLEIKMEGGTFRVHGDRIRWVLRRPDGGLLRSTILGKFKVKRGSSCTVTLKGAGYGHGVGMCQFGAMELARRGKTAPQILRHYYRGITLERWW